MQRSFSASPLPTYADQQRLSLMIAGAFFRSATAASDSGSADKFNARRNAAPFPPHSPAHTPYRGHGVRFVLNLSPSEVAHNFL